MAKKSRTPPPPRRSVQAPRARTDAIDRRKRVALYVIAGSGLVMLTAVLLAMTLLDRGSSGDAAKSPAAALEEAGCTLRSFEGQGQQHTDNLNAKIKYNSFPPTSGRHYFQPAPWGFYDEPLSQVQVVHNLEHGGVAIQYGNRVPAATRGQLEEFYREDPRGLVVAPLPRLEDRIAMTAWTVSDPGDEEGLIGTGRLATCKHFDEDAMQAFLDAYRFKGPESCLRRGQLQCFRPEDLEPGE